jgi:hypothetical protein
MLEMWGALQLELYIFCRQGVHAHCALDPAVLELNTAIDRIGTGSQPYVLMHEESRWCCLNPRAYLFRQIMTSNIAINRQPKGERHQLAYVPTARRSAAVATRPSDVHHFT